MAVNPVTLALLQRLGAHQIEAFVLDWDALEALVIRVYKKDAATRADENEYRSLKKRLAKNYSRWQPRLKPFWLGKPIGGVPARTDPFLRLIASGAAHEFIGDWEAMQTLPAARQALNEYLVDLLERKSGE